MKNTCLRKFIIGIFTVPFITGCHFVKKDSQIKEYTYQEPTYVWDGDKCTATRVCNEDANKNETETVTATFVQDNAANCDNPQNGHLHADFSNPIFADQDTEKGSITNGEPLGHLWASATYSWTNNYQNCTATIACRRNSSHNIIENGVVNFVMDTPATCLNDAKGHNVATFTNSAFQTQQTVANGITVNGTKLEHEMSNKGICQNGCGQYFGETVLEENDYITDTLGPNQTIRFRIHINEGVAYKLDLYNAPKDFTGFQYFDNTDTAVAFNYEQGGVFSYGNYVVPNINGNTYTGYVYFAISSVEGTDKFTARLSKQINYDYNVPIYRLENKFYVDTNTKQDFGIPLDPNSPNSCLQGLYKGTDVDRNQNQYIRISSGERALYRVGLAAGEHYKYEVDDVTGLEFNFYYYDENRGIAFIHNEENISLNDQEPVFLRKESDNAYLGFIYIVFENKTSEEIQFYFRLSSNHKTSDPNSTIDTCCVANINGDLCGQFVGATVEWDDENEITIKNISGPAAVEGEYYFIRFAFDKDKYGNFDIRFDSDDVEDVCLYCNSTDTTYDLNDGSSYNIEILEGSYNILPDDGYYHLRFKVLNTSYNRYSLLLTRIPL